MFPHHMLEQGIIRDPIGTHINYYGLSVTFRKPLDCIDLIKESLLLLYIDGFCRCSTLHY